MLDIKQISQIVYNAVNEAFSIYDNVENAILVYYNTLNENLPDFIDHENSDKFYNNDYYFQPTTHPYIKEEYRVFVKNHINEAVKLYPKSLSAEDTLSAIKNSIYLKDEWIYVKKYNSTDKLPRYIKISVPVKKLNSEFENILKINFSDEALKLESEVDNDLRLEIATRILSGLITKSNYTYAVVDEAVTLTDMLISKINEKK